MKKQLQEKIQNPLKRIMYFKKYIKYIKKNYD